MESISKSPQPAVGLCSGNTKQLRKQAPVVHTAPPLQLWSNFSRISVSGNVPCACFQILSRIILSQSCLSTEHVFRERINRNLIALLGECVTEGSFEVQLLSDVGLGFFFPAVEMNSSLSTSFVLVHYCARVQMLY